MARRTGKIARLSRDERNEINCQLERGKTYKEICTWLREVEGYDGFNEGHISSWFQGGYQDWVEENLRICEIKERVDLARELGGGLDGDAFQEASLQLAASHFFEVLSKLDVSALQEQLVAEPQGYVRLIHSLCRLTKSRREFLVYQQERKASEQQISQLDVIRAGLKLEQSEEMTAVREQLREEARAERLSRRKKTEDGGLRMEDSQAEGSQRQSRDEGPGSRASKTEGGEGIEDDDEGKEEGKKTEDGQKRSRAVTGTESGESVGKCEQLRVNASSCESSKCGGASAECGIFEPKSGEPDRPARGTKLRTKVATEGGAPVGGMEFQTKKELANKMGTKGEPDALKEAA